MVNPAVQTPSAPSVVLRAGTWLALIAIIVVAVVLRLRHAAGSMAFDEMASMYFSGQPWGHLWGWWMLRETNPPLFYALLKLWRMAVPMGHWPMRALPLLIGFANLALFGGYVRARLGWPAALLGLVLMALSPSDIYQADYLRAYGLARLAVMVSFVGLVEALEAPAARRGWWLYTGGAVVAIHGHTTMVLWPVIATLAVLADAAVRRDRAWATLRALLLADGATMVLSGWVLVMALAQIKGQAVANIMWLQPLGWDDLRATGNLQLLTGGLYSAIAMGALMLIGAWRARHVRAVRLAIGVVIGTLMLFKAADLVHPVISDFTLHWCFSFTALIAAAALYGADAQPQRRGAVLVPALVLAGVAFAAVIDLWCVDAAFVPQDLRRTVRTAAARRDAVLLASHEAVGVVIEQSCLVELGRLPCPFALVVMADPRQTDTWAFGGYHGRLVAPGAVRAALGGARVVYAFSRYYYTPLQHVGLDPADWPAVFWDDGELIGPMPIRAFDPPAPGDPPRVPDMQAQYSGAPDADR